MRPMQSSPIELIAILHQTVGNENTSAGAVSVLIMTIATASLSFHTFWDVAVISNNRSCCFIRTLLSYRSHNQDNKSTMVLNTNKVSTC